MLNEHNCLLTELWVGAAIVLHHRFNQSKLNQKLYNNLKLFIMRNLRNSVQLIGRLGNDPEMIQLESGKKLVKFSIATDDSYKNAKGERVEETTWHNIIMWGAQAEVAEKYFKKGKELMIEGRLQTRKYESKEGETRYATEVVANDFIFIGKKDA